MLHNCTTFGLIKSRNYILHYFRPSGPFFFFWVFTFCNVVSMINISLRSTVRDAPSLCAKVLSNRPDLVRSTIGASRHSRLKAKPSPEHPKWERNLQFLPLSETKGIPTIPYTGDRGALPRGWGGKVRLFLMRLLRSLSPSVILGPFTIWVVRADRWLVWNAVSRLLPLTNLWWAD